MVRPLYPSDEAFWSLVSTVPCCTTCCLCCPHWVSSLSVCVCVCVCICMCVWVWVCCLCVICFIRHQTPDTRRVCTLLAFKERVGRGSRLHGLSHLCDTLGDTLINSSQLFAAITPGVQGYCPHFRGLVFDCTVGCRQPLKWETHKTMKGLQKICTETLLTSLPLLRAAFTSHVSHGFALLAMVLYGDAAAGLAHAVNAIFAIRILFVFKQHH